MTRRRWVVATGVLAVTAIAYIDRVNLSVAEPVLQKEFGTTAAVLGVVLSSFTWTYTVFSIPAGIVVDRVRTRVLVAGGLALAGALLWGFGLRAPAQVRGLRPSETSAM